MLSVLKLLGVAAVGLLLAGIVWGLLFAGFPIIVGVVVGSLGGLVMILYRRRHGPLSSNPFASGSSGLRLNPPTVQREGHRDRGPDGVSTDVINASRIHVAGVGGLGLVAMAAAVALELPRVGFSVTLGLLGGGLIALAVILFRRRRGPLPTGGATRGARSLLADETVERDRPASRETTRARRSTTLMTARKSV
jgi:hypothetical protein